MLFKTLLELKSLSNSAIKDFLLILYTVLYKYEILYDLYLGK